MGAKAAPSEKSSDLKKFYPDYLSNFKKLGFKAYFKTIT